MAASVINRFRALAADALDPRDPPWSEYPLDRVPGTPPFPGTARIQGGRARH
ncbi:hypothetical protein AB0C21_42935 [Spirillospora sp. NPDC049024]